MAEHVRNELARSGVPVRPSRILTLAKFIEPFTSFADAPESLVHLLVAEHGPASEFPGFHRALAALVGQLPDLSVEIEHQLALRGMALREQRLRTAEPVVEGPVILDGFFTLSPAELELLAKLAEQIEVTVTLPTWPGSASARERILELGFLEQCMESPLRHPKRAVRAALSLQQEVEQIALSIIQHAEHGRDFREMGVLLRVRDPYAPALETVFARFGIPARFHFADAPAAHPAIQFLTGVIRSLLTGWNHADLVTLLRMPISGRGATPEGDALDFEMRESLPCSGAGSRPALSQFHELTPWLRDRLAPAEWAQRLKTIRTLIPSPEITDRVNQEQLNIWRSTSAALNAFEETLDIAAQASPERSITLAAFWPKVEAALSIEKLRIADRRRNVVNVLDVYEARQWELPVVYVCGLNERHFPQYHRDNPLLPDPARTREKQDEERFLFELATSRATAETNISYARYNDKGDLQLRSFFLPEEGEPFPQIRILPAVAQVPDLSIPETFINLRTLHAKLAPTSIETFLQCPFQFFARKTLKLRQRPEKPRDRLDNLLQGSILHQALAEGDLDRAFEAACTDKNIPRTYRREAVRLELLRHFEAFQSDTSWPLTWARQTEQKFEFALTPELSIRGRIDRLDVGAGNQGIVIDYKYSAAAKIRERVESDPIQAGLYLLAAERVFHLHPAGMFYCGLRQSVTWEGWHTAVPGLTIGESTTPAALGELVATAQARTLEVFESIAAGRMEVHPTDRDKCRYCDFKNICRVESISRAAAQGGE